MKQLALILVGVFLTISSFADNAKTTTSRGYVDTQIATKQDKVPAVDTNTVITTTGTTGEIGEKAIYNASGNYAEQTDALVTAADANAAVQNAIDTEFVCIEWAPNTAQTPENCYIWKIQNRTAHPSSKNLLDDSFMDNSTYGPITVNGYNFTAAKVLPTENGKTYTLSATINTTGPFYYYLGEVSQNGTLGNPDTSQCRNMWNSNQGRTNGTRATCTFTAQDNVTYTVYFAGNDGTVNMAKANLTLTEYQMEEGSVATEYEPYKNLYLPSGD